MQSIFLAMSIFFALLSPVVGVVAVLGGEFRPQRMTRFLILLTSFLFVGTLWAQGDRGGIYIAGAQLIGAALLFGLSIRRGMGGRSLRDWAVLLLCAAALLIWKSTDNPLLGLVMSIVADVVAFTPTLVKMWSYPETESWKFYASDVLASTFSLLALPSYSLATTVFPLYIWIINMTSVAMILGRRKVV